MTFVSREQRNAARQLRLAARKSALIQKYQDNSLQVYLEWTNAVMRPPQQLIMKAILYFELDMDSLRAYHHAELR